MDLNTAVHIKHSEPTVSSYLWISVWGPDSEGHENITNKQKVSESQQQNLTKNQTQVLLGVHTTSLQLWFRTHSLN